MLSTSERELCRRLIELEISRITADLAPLEKGEMTVAERVAHGAWREVTPAVIAAHRRTLATLDTVLRVITGVSH